MSGASPDNTRNPTPQNSPSAADPGFLIMPPGRLAAEGS